MPKPFLKTIFLCQPVRIGRLGVALMRRRQWRRYSTYRCPMWASWEFGILRLYWYTDAGLDLERRVEVQRG